MSRRVYLETLAAFLALLLLFAVIAGVIPSVRDTTGHQYSQTEP